MKTATTLATTLTVVSVLAVTGSSAGEGVEPVDFAGDIAPIFARHCLRCHSAALRRGDLSLAMAEDLVAGRYLVPGDPDASVLVEVISASEGESPEMPKEGDPLSDEEVALVRRWIAGGARWPEGVVVRESSRADSSWWSLRPLGGEAPPSPERLPEAWRAHPIDRFVGARLVERGLRPNPLADRRTLIRRAAYDLTGLPPTPDEVAEFTADPAPDAWERLIDRLLDSPRYGERWGRHWLDVVRFGESRGFERNEIINNLWPFRDYVIRSLNEDRPFDQFIREHLAGDVTGEGDPSVEIASAFLVAGPYDDVGNQDPEQAAQIRANTIDEMIRATGEAFLGLTVGCARCHHHKFDPIAQRDYYGLYATFAGVHHGDRVVATPEERGERARKLEPLATLRERLEKEREAIRTAVLARAQASATEYEELWTRPPVSRRGTEEVFPSVEARHVKLVVEGQEQNPAARTGYRIEEFEVWTAGDEPRNVALKANGGTARGASRVAGDFAGAYSADLAIDGKLGASWIAAGPELTITFARPHTIRRILFWSDRTGAAGDHPVANFVSEYHLLVSVDGEQWARVASSHDRRPINEAHRRRRLLELEITAAEERRLSELGEELREVTRKIAAIPPLPRWWIGTRQAAAGPFHVFLGGSPQRPGEMVRPSSLSALAGVAPSYELTGGKDEGERRRALADWIVDTRNPLTPRVLANRIWHYHFGVGIVDTPSDLGYMGGRPTHPELLDWLARQIHENGWRLKPLHRLIMTSQAYRQSSDYRKEAAQTDADSRFLWRFPPRRLSAEEIRDTILQLAGKLDTTMGGPGFRLYRYLQDNVATYVPLDEHGPETFRRAVYHQNARAARVDLLSDFDQPDCAFAAPRRAETTTPLQALTMLNHHFTLEMARFMSARLESDVGASHPVACVRRAFELCYSRLPGEEELEACVRLVAGHGLPALCRVLLNTSELIHVE